MITISYQSRTKELITDMWWQFYSRFNSKLLNLLKLLKDELPLSKHFTAKIGPLP